MVQQAAECRALAGKGAELVRRELEVVGLSRHHVALEEELRNVEAVVHVLGDQGDFDALIDRHDHLWVGRSGTEDLDLLGWIGELPLPLVADHLDLDPNVLRLSGIDNVEHASRGEEEGDDNNEGDHRPDDF